MGVPRGIHIAAVVLAAVAMAGCGEATAPGEASYVSFAVNTPSYVARLEVTASRPPAETVVTFVPVNGTVQDSIELTAGTWHITVRAFDASRVNTHRGDTTVLVHAGVNAAVSLLLEPLTGLLPIEIGFGQNEVILFESSRSGLNAVWRVNPDGSGLRKISPDTVTVFEASPRMRPGRRLLAFNRVDAGLWLMNLDGSGRTQMVAAGGAGALAWSPDGAEIYYSEVNTCGEDVFAVRPDGSARRLVVAGGTGGVSEAVINHPTVSSYGVLAFVATNCGSPGATGTLYTALTDGTGVTPIVSAVFSASWSPDGSTLLMDRWNGTGYELWTSAGDGTGLTHLSAIPASSSPFYPGWSPLGGRIVYSSCGGGVCGLKTANPDGSGEQQVTSSPGDFRPHWARNG